MHLGTENNSVRGATSRSAKAIACLRPLRIPYAQLSLLGLEKLITISTPFAKAVDGFRASFEEVARLRIERTQV